MEKWIQVVQHIPVWVGVLFIGILVLGLIQTRTRIVSLYRVLILPVVMIIFSFYGVTSSFGIRLSSIGYWLIGMMLAWLLSSFYKYPKDARYDTEKKVFFLHGSFVPLILMMGIFFTKFFVGYAKGRALPIIENGTTISMVCILLGFFSGMFFASGYVLYRVKRNSTV